MTNKLEGQCILYTFDMLSYWLQVFIHNIQEIELLCNTIPTHQKLKSNQVKLSSLKRALV